MECVFCLFCSILFHLSSHSRSFTAVGKMIFFLEGRFHTNQDKIILHCFNWQSNAMHKSPTIFIYLHSLKLGNFKWLLGSVSVATGETNVLAMNRIIVLFKHVVEVRDLKNLKCGILSSNQRWHSIYGNLCCQTDEGINRGNFLNTYQIIQISHNMKIALRQPLAIAG